MPACYPCLLTRSLAYIQMCIVHFKERERLAPGARMDDRVLFIEEVSYESVRKSNKPLLVLLSQVR